MTMGKNIYVDQNSRKKNMTPLMKGMLWFIPGLLILVFIGIYFFDEDQRVEFTSLKKKLWKARGGFFVVFIVFAFLQVENFIHDIHPPGFRVTWWFYSVEGVDHIVWLQQTLDNPLIVHASSIFYVLGLSFFVAFTPIFFILRDQFDVFEQFCKALAVNYVFLLLGYFLLHVLVTSFYKPDEVQALLYDHPQYNAIVQLTNRQSNCFPSGHTSIPLTITLISGYSAGLKRLKIFGFIFVILTVFTIIYLGIHWILDIPAGIAVALFAYWSTSEGKSDWLFDRVTEPFERWTERLRSGYRG